MIEEKKPSFYFSAYRLKELKQASSSSNENNQSPYLKALLSGKTKTMSRVRTFPLVNPYKEKDSVAVKQTSLIQDDFAAKEKNWFHNYE